MCNAKELCSSILKQEMFFFLFVERDVHEYEEDVHLNIGTCTPILPQSYHLCWIPQYGYS